MDILMAGLLVQANLLASGIHPPPQPDALIAAAEALIDRKLADSAETVLRVGLAFPDMTRLDRARLHLLEARLYAEAKDELGMRSSISKALGLDRAITLPATAPAHLLELLEDERARLPPEVAQPPLPSEPEQGGSPAALLLAVDALYKQLQFEGAEVALQAAGPYGPLPSRDQAQLVLWRGLIKIEQFEEAEARRLFGQALKMDPDARLPGFAPPQALRAFEEVRTTVERPRVESRIEAPHPRPAAPPPHGFRAWAWTPMVGGAALEAAGLVCYFKARSEYRLIAGNDARIISIYDFRATADAGRAYQGWAFALVGTGAAALGMAAVMYLWDGPGALHASVQAAPSSVGLTLSGAFP